MINRSISAALIRARNTAMFQSIYARIPECGHFGNIAQDLSYACDAMGIGDPVTVDKTWAAGIVESMGAGGYGTLAIAEFLRTAEPGVTPPEPL